MEIVITSIASYINSFFLPHKDKVTSFVWYLPKFSEMTNCFLEFGVHSRGLFDFSTEMVSSHYQASLNFFR